MDVAPIAVALDAPDIATMRTWAGAVAGSVACLKVGLEVFCRHGHEAVSAAREAAAHAGHPGIDVFLDLKLHDIPATVAGAARALAPLTPAYLTVHASGGPQMVQAAATALPNSRIAAVTVLTSLDSHDVSLLGLQGSVHQTVVRWARMAVDAGARAVVCSPQEVSAVRSAVGADIHLITPGIRPAGSEPNDQRRSATPREALDAGADLLVIGRPITGQQDPGTAARLIAQECAR